MKTKSLYIGTCCSFLLSVAASGAPQAPTNQNYIKTRTYCTSNGQTYYDDLQYYDGLGKPYMSVNVNATPSNKDFIALTDTTILGGNPVNGYRLRLRQPADMPLPKISKPRLWEREGITMKCPMSPMSMKIRPMLEYSNNANRERLCRGAGRQRQKHII